MALTKDGEDAPLLHDKTPSTLNRAVSYVVHQAPMIILLLVVIGLGSANRVIYKIQLTPMGNYPLFISWIITIAYCLLYWSILSIRRYMGIITRDMMGFSMKYMYMGVQVASSDPTNTAVTILMLKARYNLWQVIGAVVIIVGEVTSLIPSFAGGTHASVGWIGFFILSIIPSAVSFVLKESVFVEHPNMDIFVVNSMDSAFQLVFTFASLPIVLIPGFGGIPFSELPAYITNAGFCFAGINHRQGDDCRGEPWVSLLYMAVNLSWNISLLLLVKRGGAVLTFIAAAVSLPIAHLAFAFNWPLLRGQPLHWEDAIALVTILAGLVIYRVASIMKARADARAKEVDLVTPDTVAARKGM